MSKSPLSTPTEIFEAPQAAWTDWRWQIRHSARTPEDLAGLLELAPQALRTCRQVAGQYPLRVTPYYLSLATSRTLDDPILRQCVPAAEETAADEGSHPDPFAERRLSPVPGLVHRYPDRALLVLTRHCAVRCRHCMRKRLWADAATRDEVLATGQLDAALAYLRRTPQVREVLLSGGDPLLLPIRRLTSILRRLHALPNIDVVRIATRLPVVLPFRLTEIFCRQLGQFQPTWIVTHFNHPAELSAAATDACANLVGAGLPVVNQTVLLRQVNDDPETLRRLFTGLLRMRVKPYYLFHGDPVAGTCHFRTGIAAGLRIMEALQGRMSGLALPVFAIDLPGGAGKVPLFPNREITPSGDARIRSFRGYDGRSVDYPDA